MKIGMDGTALYGRYGGVEYAIWNLLSALHAVDAENYYTIYIPHDGPPPSQLKPFGVRWNWVRLPFRGAQKWRRIAWQQTQFAMQAKRDNCDLIHAPAYVAPLSSPLPVVLTVYDFIALSHPQFATHANRFHYSALLKRSVARARRIIVPSEAVQRELSWRVPQAAARTCVVPLGIEPLFLEPVAPQSVAQLRARYHLPDKFLLFVGNAEPKKNLANLLRALTLLPTALRLPLVVTGGARAWAGYEIEAVAPAINDATQGHNALQTLSVGYVGRRDLPTLYTACAAFVFPSLAEGFGLPVLEALASGAAVIASDRVPLPQLKEVAQICHPYQPSSIAQAIERVLGNASLRQKMQHDGREYARAFTWSRAAQMTLEVYHAAHHASRPA